MSHSACSFRLRIALSFFIIAVLFILQVRPAGAVPLQVPQPTGPKIWLQDNQPLGVRHNGPAAAMARAAQPVSMATGDIDGDGVNDLLVGYRSASGGFISVHRGNLDAFAPQSDASLQAVGRGQFPSPFLTDARTFSVPITPDFLALGNFTGKGNQDLVVATKGGGTLLVFAGDGKGNFGSPQTINLPGRVTSLSSGQFGGTHLPSIVAGVSVAGNSNSELVVFTAAAQGLAPVAAVPVTGAISNILFGNFGGGPDVAFLAGGKVQVLRSATGTLASVSVPGTAVAFALGSFIFDRTGGLQIAILGSDGSVQIAARSEFDARTYTVEEFRSIRKAKVLHQAPPLGPLAGFPNSWKIVDTYSSVGTSASGQTPVFFTTRVSSNGPDDIMWLNAGNSQMAVISHPTTPLGAQTFVPGQVSIKPYAGSPLHALPMRINIDGRPGIVAIHQGETLPSVSMPIPDPTFFPNRFDDIAPRGTGASCLNTTGVDASGDCTLREAVIKANATAGTDNIQLQAGTYTLTRGRVASPLYDAQDGTLNINDSVNITGAVDGSGNPTTTITWGALTSGASVDMIMAVNEDISPITDATASISNVIFDHGINHGIHSNDGDGGCMEFDTGSSGNANLTLTNVIIQNCATTAGGGGGLVVFNFVNHNHTGFATITNSTIQNNSAVDNPSSGAGGGIGVSNDARIVVSNSKILNNSATQVTGGGQKGQGGGVILFFPNGTFTGNPESDFHNVTISGNKAAGFGGGIQNQADAVIDQGSVISNNVAGTDGINPVAGQEGGGIYANTFNAVSCPVGLTCATTLSKVTITGNSATGNGGGISNGSGSASGPLTMIFTRLAGNTTGSSGSNLNNSNAIATVTNNWWGTNSPASTINSISATTTFDPFIVLTHNATPAKIRINQSTTLTGDMSKDNHGNGAALTGNLNQIVGLPITFDNAVLGTIPQAQPETVNASGQATATFNAGGTSGRGSANATVDQSVQGANSNLIASATEAGTTATITTVGLHNFAANQTVVIAGVGVAGYNGTFTILSTPTPTTFTYTTTAGLGASSGGTANVGIIILEPPQITKSFGAAAIPVNGTTTVSFSINNPNVVAINASFTDTLPLGLQVAATPGLTNTCGGTVTATTGSGSISFSNNLTPIGVCTIAVNITGTADNNYTNSVQILSTDAGNGNTSSANITVINPPHIVKAFGAATIPLNGTTSLTFTIDSNGNQNLTQTGVAFTDNLPAGLVNATPSNVTTNCAGGTAIAVNGGSSVSLSGASIPPASSCTLSVNVQGTTAGVKNNSVQVTSTNAGTGNTSSASITVVAPPAISKAFGAASIPLNGTTTVTFTINNPNTTAAGDLTGVAFSDALPNTTGTLIVAAIPGVSNTCGGTVTATGGTGVISLSGASVVHSASCTLSVNVTGTAAGDAVNTTGAITSTEGGTGTTSNTATLKVVAPPAISKAFGAATVPLNGTTTETFTITNLAANTTSETGIAFSDTLTGGLQVASTPGVSNTCGGTVTAAANATSISLSGGSIATPGNTCTISVNVTGTQAGTVTNTTGAVSSTNGGTGSASNTANLIVVAPPTITKAFGAATIPLNGTTSLTFTINNSNTGATLNGVAFTDNLPAGLVVASTPNLSNTCGGTATAVGGSGSVSLSAGSLAGSASCTVSVNVHATTAGVKNNSVQVTSTEGGTGNTSNASITVVAPPTISKAFGAAAIPLNGTTTATFTISNPNTTVDLTGVAFSDTLPNSTGTLVVAGTPGVSNTCGGTVTATAGTGVITLSGGSVVHNASCTLTVNVTGTAAGDAVNTTGAITSTEGGTGTASNSATLKIVSPPTIAKAFGASAISLNGTTTVTFTITNPAANTAAENGIAFSDTLTGGLQVASTPGVSNTCGGTVTAAANSTSISLTGGSIATPAATCTIVVNVTGTQSGIVTNTTGAVSSTNGGTGTTSNTATLIVASPASVTKTFGATKIPLNGTTSLTINITNPNTNVSLTGLAFTDNLPAGLAVATPNGLTNSCGGTATATAGSGAVSLSGGTLASSASCVVSVNVTGTTAGDKINSVQVSSTEGGTSATASASITVVAPPTISKAFGAASIPLNGTTTVTFTVSNPNNPATPANGDLTGVAFSDTLPSTTGTLVVAATPGVSNTCGGTVTATAGTGVISLSGGSVAHNASCTLTVNVTGTAAGDAVNTSGAITSTEGGTGTTSNTATIKVVAAPSIAKVFNPSTISLNATTSLSFTITNPAANTVALAGVAFTDILPTGLTVANASATVCGGTLTTTAPTGISLSGATVSGNSQCQFSVTVTGAASGQYTNTTGNVTSTNGGTGNTASASLTVASAPTITKAFGAATLPLNGTTSLTFNISNPNSNVTLTGIAFTDNLPAGLVIASTPNLSNTCGGTATAVSGSGLASLSAGTLAASASCTVSVNVQGTTAGIKNNSVQVTSTEGGTGNIASAQLTVPLANTTTDVTSSVNPSIFGQSVTFTATVSVVAPAAGAPTGTVTFLDGGSPIGTGTLSGGIAAFTTSALAVGNHTITTSYGGDSNFNGSTGSLTGNPQVVNKADTVATVTSSANPSVFGQPVTFSAAISAVGPGSGTPTGSVTFFDGGTPIGSGTLSGGIVTFTTSILTIGNHTITTSYGGDGNFNGSVGSLTGNPQVVNQATTITTIASSQGTIALGDAVTFTATVSVDAPGTGTPSGLVVFFDGSNPIASGTLNGGSPDQVIFSTSLLTVGSHSITAIYFGDANFIASPLSSPATETVNLRATTTSVALNPTSVGAGQASATTITVTDAGASTPPGTASAFSATGATATLRTGFTSTLFADGLVVVAGGTGSDGTTILNSAEIYSVSGAVFTATGNLNTARTGAVAVLLPNGKVLVAGGSSDGTAAGALNSAELFDPIAGTFNTSSHNMTAARFATTATLLPSGKVLIAGGQNAGGALITAELYDPATDTFTGTGNLSFARTGASATLLGTGKVLVAGGSSDGTATGALSSAEVFDPAGNAGAGTFTSVAGTSPTLASGRWQPEAALLSSGKVLIAGGENSGGVLTTADLYDPAADSFNASTHQMNEARSNGSAVTLPNGMILLPGGTTSQAVELYDPQNDKFNATGSLLQFDSGLVPTLLNNGQVLVVGLNIGGVPSVADAELYSPSFNPLGTVGLSSSEPTDTFGPACVLTPSTGGTSTCSSTTTPTQVATSPHTITGTYSADTVHSGSSNSASLTVIPTAAPAIAKAFSASKVGQNSKVNVSFTIVNPNAAATLTGISFTDALPAGLIVATPNNLISDCGGTLTAVAGSSSISLAGGSLAPAAPTPLLRKTSLRQTAGVASGQCVITADLLVTGTGTIANTTGPVSANESGAGNPSNTATLDVVLAPTASKAFGAATIALNASTSLTFNLANPNTGTTLVGIALTDALPAGLVVANPNGLTGSCVASSVIGATAGASSINLSSLNLTASGSCSFSVNVTGASGGLKNNTTSPVTATFDDGSGTFVGLTGTAASASISVLAPDPAITKTHAGKFTRGQTGAQWTLTVSNVGFGPTVGTVTVVDTLPNVQNPPVPTDISGTGWTCTLATLTCTRADALPSGSSYPPITLTADIPKNIQNNFTNTATLSGGGDVNPSNNTATDPISLGPPIIITPHATSATVTAGGAAQVVFDVEDDDPTLGMVTFGCSGLPIGASCTFNPPATNQPLTQVTMSLSTSNGVTVALADQHFGGRNARLYAMLTFPVFGLVAIGLTGRKNRKTRTRLVLSFIGLVSLLAFAGCGGGAHRVTTPPGTYTITVTAATTTVQVSTQVTLNVQ